MLAANMRIAFGRYFGPPHPPTPCSSGVPEGEGEIRIEEGLRDRVVRENVGVRDRVKFAKFSRQCVT